MQVYAKLRQGSNLKLAILVITPVKRSAFAWLAWLATGNYQVGKQGERNGVNAKTMGKRVALQWRPKVSNSGAVRRGRGHSHT